MLKRLEKIEERYLELEQQMASPEVATNLKKLQELAQERAGLENLVSLYRRYKEAAATLETTRPMLNDETDEEMAAMVKQEIESLELQLENLLQEIKISLLPKDANDDRDIIMEIRAGTGGEEAGLFAADLFRMYSHYASLSVGKQRL